MKDRIIEDARQIVRYAHGCEAAFVTSVVIKEELPGKQVWEGEVDIFYLHGHPKTNCCFVVTHHEASETLYTPVLALPPIINAQAAVRKVLFENGPCG